MTDQELREMIRESIARHLDAGPLPGPEPTLRIHPSHESLPLAQGADGDGACLIEPAVRCSHCGYCVSYGH
jgi:hypothetical protein